MSNFENQLDEIRVALYEETKGSSKEDIIRKVNTHAKEIAAEFGISITNMAGERCPSGAMTSTL